MIERRDFIIRVGTVLVSLPIFAACGDDNTTPNTQTGTLRFTSSEDAGHSHTVDIELTALANPPMSIDKTTSSVGHTHMVSLTSDDLRSINTGGTISKQTTTDEGHLHTFTFVKATGVAV